MKKTLSAITALVLAAAALPALADTVYSQDFEADANGFTGGFLDSSQGYAGYGFGNTLLHTGDAPGGLATLTLNLAQAHSAVSLNASLAIIDSWDNGAIGSGPDIFSVVVDRQVKFSAVFDNFQNQGPTTLPGLSTLFYGKNVGFNNSYNDAGYGLSLALGDLSAGTHTIQFVTGGPGWQGLDDESLGIDNVHINGTPVPEPAPLALVFAGLAAVGGLARRRKAK